MSHHWMLYQLIKKTTEKITSQAFTATTLDDNKEQHAFQAGIEFEKRHADSKRQRTDIQCNHWNGTVCDFQQKTGKNCNFSQGHTLGTSTFKNAYIPSSNKSGKSHLSVKNDDIIVPTFGDYQLWLKDRALSKDVEGGSSSSK